MFPGISSVLHISGCQPDIMVDGRVLLLRRCYLSYLSFQHYNNGGGNASSKS